MSRINRAERTALYGLVLALTLVLGWTQWRIYNVRSSWTMDEVPPLLIGQNLEYVAHRPFQTHTGDTVTIDDLIRTKDSGMLVFLDPECEYCYLDVPLWRLLTQKTMVIGITEETDQEKVKSFALENRIEFPIIIDINSELISSLDLIETPTKLAISSDLRVLQVWYGWTTQRSAQSEIGSLLFMYGIEPDELPEFVPELASGVPPGCSITSEDSGCKRCGVLWRNEKTYQKIRYRCSDGSRGSHDHYGSCGSC